MNDASFSEDGIRVKKEFYKENGKVKSEKSYNISGHLHGQCLEFYEDGKLKSVINYKDNHLDGEYIRFFRTGEKYKECNYRKGKMNGENKDYFPSGKMSHHNHYKNGNLYGVHKEFYQSGNVKILREYVNGGITMEKLYKDGEYEELEKQLKDEKERKEKIKDMENITISEDYEYNL